MRQLAWSMLAVVLCCTSCGAGADVHAVRDPHFTGRMHSLYLAINQGGIDPAYAEGFVAAFKRELERRGVSLTWRVVNGLELDRNLLSREVATSRADGVLIVIPVRGTAYYGEITNLTWDVSLIDVASGGRIWRARVENRKAAGAWGSTDGMVDEAAVNIAKELGSERLLADGG